MDLFAKLHSFCLSQYNKINAISFYQNPIFTVVQHTKSKHLSIAVMTSFSSVAQSCPTLCDPKNCSTPGFPVHHQLLELAQTHIHQVSDAIQPSHPLSSPSPSAFNLSQQTGCFLMSQFSASGGQSIGASVSVLLIFKTDFL